MKDIKTKAQIRAEINNQIDSFLSEGGHVDQIRQGESGRQGNVQMAKPPQLEHNQQTRTPVLSEIKAIEARRQKPKPASSEPRRSNREEKKALLTDDFGEPLRWIPK